MANAHATPQIAAAAPDLYAGSAVEVGMLWCDTVNALWKKCTSTSPLTYTSIETGGGGGEPVDASYLVLGANGTLTNERVLTAGSNISFVDNGPGSTLVVNSTGGGGSGNTYFPSGWM